MNDIQESQNKEVPQIPDRMNKPKVLPRTKRQFTRQANLIEENPFPTILDRKNGGTKIVNSWDSSDSNESYSSEISFSSPSIEKKKEESKRVSPIIIMRVDDSPQIDSEYSEQKAYADVFPPPAKYLYSEDIQVRILACRKIQRTYRRHLATREEKQKFGKLFRQHIQRKNAVNELLTTEKTYVGILECIVEVYLKPLQESLNSDKPLILPNLIPDIFSEVVNIFTVNRIFCNMLEKIVKNWTPYSKLSPIIMDMSDNFLEYHKYIANYSNAIHILDELKKKKSFDLFLQNCVTKIKGGLPSLLIAPVQRIPRYKLLLIEILKNTWETHPDYQGLSQAVEKIKEIALTINEKIREAESTNRISQLQNQIAGLGKQTLLKPGRRLIKEANLTVIDKGTTLNCAIFLFNDIFLICKGKKLELHRLDNLSEITASKEKPDPLSFTLISLKESAVTMITQSEEETNEWVELLNAPVEDEAPEIVRPFDEFKPSKSSSNKSKIKASSNKKNVFPRFASLRRPKKEDFKRWEEEYEVSSLDESSKNSDNSIIPPPLAVVNVSEPTFLAHSSVPPTPSVVLKDNISPVVDPNSFTSNTNISNHLPPTFNTNIPNRPPNLNPPSNTSITNGTRGRSSTISGVTELYHEQHNSMQTRDDQILFFKKGLLPRTDSAEGSTYESFKLSKKGEEKARREREERAKKQEEKAKKEEEKNRKGEEKAKKELEKKEKKEKTKSKKEKKVEKATDKKRESSINPTILHQSQPQTALGPNSNPLHSSSLSSPHTPPIPLFHSSNNVPTNNSTTPIYPHTNLQIQNKLVQELKQVIPEKKK